METNVELRAHHLLCISSFRGRGYNDRFIHNLGKIIGDLKSDPDRKVRVVASCDDICSACPHCESNRCRKRPGSKKLVREMDDMVSEKLEISRGDEKTIEELTARLRENITGADLSEICADCEWHAIRCAEKFDPARLMQKASK